MADEKRPVSPPQRPPITNDDRGGIKSDVTKSYVPSTPATPPGGTPPRKR